MCVAAGMFNHVKPKRSSVNNARGQDGAPLNDVVQNGIFSPSSKFGQPQLTTLVVDLSTPDVWASCAKLIEHYCDLKELGLAGCFNKTLDKENVDFFLNSDLGLKEQFGRFRGHTLSLKNLHLRLASFEILCFVPRQHVTTIFLERSSLDLEKWILSEMSKCTAFPALERVSFVGNDLAQFPFPSACQDDLVQLFTAGAALTHFEVSSGCNLGQSSDVDTQWFSSLLSIITTLQNSACDSLETFMDKTNYALLFSHDDYTESPQFYRSDSENCGLWGFDAMM